jgi:hypothetical protein
VKRRAVIWERRNAVANVELPNALKTPGTAGTNGESGRPPAVEVHGLVRALRDRSGTVEAMSEQEKWLHAATADPAFWLKEIS